MFCRNCGQQINEGASFCSNCGEKIANPAGQAKPPVTPASQRTITPTPQNRQPYQAPPVQQSGYPQQPYQNPQFRQSAAPAYTAVQPPQTRSNTALLIVIIILLLILVLIGGILLFINPGYLRQNNGGDHGLLTLDSTAEPVQTASASESAITQNASATAPVTQPPETETADSIDFPQGLIGGNYNPMEEPWALSTGERPRFEEFEWCYGQFGFVRQAPENAALISDVQVYNGGWKAMIIYNPDDADGIFTRELDNISVSVDQNHTVQLTVDWYLMAPDYSEITNEEDMEDTVFTGAVTNTGISVNGSALINIDNFWHDGERQYATGTITPQNGVTGYLAMVRP